MTLIRLATRSSPLARHQAGLVAAALERPRAAATSAVEVELVAVETTGDRRSDVPITEIAGRGVFVKEVEQALLDGRADLAVHSAKDLPSTAGTEGLIIAAFPERGDPRDALVGRPLDDLHPGARIATGSVRRRAQLAWLRPDLRFPDLRGNIATRLRKIPPEGAIVVAAAALVRLGLFDHAAQILDPSELLPQVGQGALAVQCRTDDHATCALVAELDHAPTRRCVEAERAFLRVLGGGCDLPVGAYAVELESGELALEALVAAADGSAVVRSRSVGTEPEVLGQHLASELVEARGGSALLAGSSPWPGTPFVAIRADSRPGPG